MHDSLATDPNDTWCIVKGPEILYNNLLKVFPSSLKEITYIILFDFEDYPTRGKNIPYLNKGNDPTNL